jgi:hypothetical protein
MPNRGLVKLVRRDGSDAWFRLAVLSSVNGRAGQVFQLLLANKEFRATPHGREFLLALAAVIGSANRWDEIAALAQEIDALPKGQQALTRDIGRSLVAKPPPTGRARFARLAAGKAGAILADLLRDAQKTAPDGKHSVADRVAAVRLLDLALFAANAELFRNLLTFRQPQAVKAAALEVLSRFDQPSVAALVLEAWPGLSPPLRSGAVEAIFSRLAWIAAFLDAVEQGKGGRGDVDPARLQLLQTHADARLRARAAKLFAATKLAPRQDVVAAYQKALQFQGDPARGKAVFKQVCSAWHQPADYHRPPRHRHDHRGDRQRHRAPPPRRHQRDRLADRHRGAAQHRRVVHARGVGEADRRAGHGRPARLPECRQVMVGGSGGQ